MPKVRSNMWDVTDKLLVVNGSLKAWETDFLDLEVSGSVQMLNCTVRGSAELFGKVRVDGSVLHQLELYGTVFHFQDTQIKGPVRVRSPLKLKPKLVLRNSTIKGEVVFEEDIGGLIEVRP